VRKRKTNVLMIVPFAVSDFPIIASPVSDGWEKQRALNFTVPVSCSATIIRSSVHIRAIIGAFKWKYPTNGAIDASPTVKDDVVYIGSDDSYFYALDASTGLEVEESNGIIDRFPSWYR